jgi:hypothetical protein
MNRMVFSWVIGAGDLGVALLLIRRMGFWKIDRATKIILAAMEGEIGAGEL